MLLLLLLFLPLLLLADFAVHSMLLQALLAPNRRRGPGLAAPLQGGLGMWSLAIQGGRLYPDQHLMVQQHGGMQPQLELWMCRGPLHRELLPDPLLLQSTVLLGGL